MDLSSYLSQVRFRLMEEEGFLQADGHLPETLRPHVAGLLVNREQDEAVLAALVPADRLPPGAAADLLSELANVAERFAARGGCHLISAFVYSGDPPAEADRLPDRAWTDTAVGVTALPWVVNLDAGIAAHVSGPPAVDAVYRALSLAEEPRRVAQDPVAPLRTQPVEPRVTYVILGAILAVFGLIMVRGGGLEATTNEMVLIQWGAAHRPSIFLEDEWWRLASAAFLHFGPMHLFFNGFALYQLGRMVEWLFGHWRYSLIFATAALAGSAASLYFNFPLVVSAGASGGLYGLFGALLFFRIASPLGKFFSWQQILVPIGINFLFTVTIPNIDAWNHFGGIAGGFLAAAFVGLPRLSGLEEARFALPRQVHLALAALLLAGGLLLATGLLPLGGPARSFISGLGDLQQGRVDAAEPKLREGARRWDRYWQTHYYLAIALAEQGRLAEALEETNRAVSLSGGARPARELLQWLQENMKQ